MRFAPGEDSAIHTVGGEGSCAADTSRMARFPDHPNPSRILSLWADTHADNGVSVGHVRGEGVPEMGDWIGGRDGRARVRWRDIRAMRRVVRARHNPLTLVRNWRTTSRSARLSRACPNRLDVPVMKSQATVRSTTRTASPPPPSTKARTCSTVRPRWALRTPMGLPHHDDLLMMSRLRPTPGSRHAGITRPFQARFSQDKAAGTSSSSHFAPDFTPSRKPSAPCDSIEGRSGGDRRSCRSGSGTRRAK